MSKETTISQTALATMNKRYPSVDDLRSRCKQRIPKFAFEYLDGGCNDDVNIKKNTDEIRDIELEPRYFADYEESRLSSTLFGKEYSAPFGVAPVGLQGLMWPNAPEILAKAAMKFNLPFILSTVTTSSIERISKVTNGEFWFQLYHPREEKVKQDILRRAEDAGCEVLVVLSDVPSFGFRPRDIRNGLSMPPKMSVKNFIQIAGKPRWALNTLIHGQPNFETLKPYMPKNLNLEKLGEFMNDTFSGRITKDRIAKIRDQWKGKLVLKGVANPYDAEMCVRLGLDGIIVSNHGGRQLDAGESAVKSLTRIVQDYKDKLTVMMDSGIRSGPDIARVMAAGADFTFLGRSFMYGVGALGKEGGEHTMSILYRQLEQVMEQLCCERIEELPSFLVDNRLTSV